jgi:flagellar hook-length control protein FliK
VVTSDVKLNTESQLVSKESHGDIVQAFTEISDDVAVQVSEKEVSLDEIELPATFQKGAISVELSPKANRETIPGFVMQDVDEKAVLSQIAGKLNTLTRSGVTEVGIQLRPEALGEVKLRIRIEGDVVVARFQVESQQVKQIVENNIQTLKDALASQNLHAASIDVNVSRENMERETNGGERHQDNREAERTNQSFSESNLKQQSLIDSWQLTGTETGKRYGTNSIEYFA